MTEAELIFTALAELSTRQIAETDEAKGLTENAKAGKKGGKIAKDARLALEQKTGKKVVSGENFLPPKNEHKKLNDKQLNGFQTIRVYLSKSKSCFSGVLVERGGV